MTEAAPAQAIREREVAELCREIRQDVDALARYVEKNGDPAAELREMFGPDYAA